MLTLRVIGANDYTVHEDGQRVGRIRYASERSPGCWLWHVTVLIPGLPYGSAPTLDAAKAAFKSAWFEFKGKHGPEKLAKALAEMNNADRAQGERR